jgi:hypothetical protein
MTSPRDVPVRFGVPFDWETGREITDAQMGRISKIVAAYEALLETLHEAEGTPGNEGFGSRRMSIAATQIELGLMMAKRACLEAK